MFKTKPDVYNMIVFPNAKINLGLNITRRRTDGYHDLETLFYPVMIKDALEVVEAEKLSFSHSGIEVPGNPADNLCLKAYRMLAADFDLPPVNIHLHKNIPIGAGLGGGSADASFFIRLMNEKFELALSTFQLEAYASKLGADCAFFIKNEPVFAAGIGDQFEKFELNLSNYYLIVVMPPVQIPTSEAFRDVVPNIPEISLKHLAALPVEEWKHQIKNDFEPGIISKYPQIGQIKESMYQGGAVYASMSGSGSSVYGIFSERVKLGSLEAVNRVFYDV